MAPECFCFDVCAGGPHQQQGGQLSGEGISFIGRARGVHVVAPTSPWTHYLQAVYTGRAKLPFALGRLSAVYVNSPAWRAKHADTPNPFRDCRESGQVRCANSMCSAWEAELNAQVAPGTPPAISVYYWPQARWAGPAVHAERRMVQLFSTSDDSFGRDYVPSHRWIEIMREDARPYFEEGLRPPNCPDWAAGEAYQGQQCWEELHEYNGGRFPPGCWARPAVGTGVWINTNETRRAHNLSDTGSIINTSRLSESAVIYPSRRERYGRALEYILYARSEGIDTLQFTFGDPTIGGHAPLLVISSETCVGRQNPLHACLSCEVRAGWADLPCECDDSTHGYHVDYSRFTRLKEQARNQESPTPKSPFELSGTINCASVLSPPPLTPAPLPLPLASPPLPALRSVLPPTTPIRIERQACTLCEGGIASWTVGGVEEHITSLAAQAMSDPRSYPVSSAVMRSAAVEGFVASADGTTVQRVRDYLQLVYPMGAFSGASNMELLRLFRSLEFLYQDADLEVPLDALEPGTFGAGSTAGAALQCTSRRAVKFRGVLRRGAAQLYRDLLPCHSGVECVRSLSTFSPDWLDGVEQQNANTYFEVRRFSRVAWGVPRDQVPPADHQLADERGWEDFIDPHRIHGSGWWYKHAPGSGIFYSAGRTLTASTKIAMHGDGDRTLFLDLPCSAPERGPLHPHCHASPPKWSPEFSTRSARRPHPCQVCTAPRAVDRSWGSGVHMAWHPGRARPSHRARRSDLSPEAPGSDERGTRLRTGRRAALLRYRHR